MFLDYNNINDRIIVFYLVNNIFKIYKYNSYELICHCVFVKFVNIFVLNKDKNSFVSLLKILK